MPDSTRCLSKLDGSLCHVGLGRKVVIAPRPKAREGEAAPEGVVTSKPEQ